MAGKFEWQFKYRDEADVNARPRYSRGQFKKSLIAGTSAIRQIRFTLGFSDIDNHRARWHVPSGYNLSERRKGRWFASRCGRQPGQSGQQAAQPRKHGQGARTR